jgi:hypothetical protein
MKSLARWEGRALTITTPRGAGEPVVERWSLADGVLTIEIGTQKRVYRKTR